jgi:hypothetical protein
MELGTVVHTCNPSTQEAKEDSEFQANLGYRPGSRPAWTTYIVRPCVKNPKNK